MVKSAPTCSHVVDICPVICSLRSDERSSEESALGSGWPWDGSADRPIRGPADKDSETPEVAPRPAEGQERRAEQELLEKHKATLRMF